MRSLFDFLIKHISWIVFLIYVALSCILLFTFNPYQRSTFFGSSNKLVAKVYELSDEVTGYFGLRTVNDELLQRNGDLELEVMQLRTQLLHYQDSAAIDSLSDPMLLREKYDYEMARVINNSVVHVDNYITLNKGSKDGITPDMAIINQQGVVGVVAVVNDDNAVALSLLNTKWHLSCKVKNSDYFGSLSWDTESPQYATLNELPRHIHYNIGDTIVTSGFSAIFPEGLMVGTIVGDAEQKNDNFINMRIKLACDFYQLGSVIVMRNKQLDEQKQLEEEALQ